MSNFVIKENLNAANRSSTYCNVNGHLLMEINRHQEAVSVKQSMNFPTYYRRGMWLIHAIRDSRDFFVLFSRAEISPTLKQDESE